MYVLLHCVYSIVFSALLMPRICLLCVSDGLQTETTTRGAAGMLNLCNLNQRVIILATEAILTTRFIINSAEQIQTTPSVCDETADTNRPGYTV